MEYDIIQKPPRGRSEESEYYIVPVYGQTINVKQMAESITDATTLTQSDVLAAITALTGEITTALRMGNKVRIDGLGTFRLQITTPKKDLQADDKVAKKIEVRGVAFQPEKSFTKQFASVSFTRTATSRTFRRVADKDSLLSQLRTFFKDNEFLRREHVENLANCSRTTAKKFINELEAEGYITNDGTYRNPIYRATEKMS